MPGDDTDAAALHDPEPSRNVEQCVGDPTRLRDAAELRDELEVLPTGQDLVDSSELR